MRRRQVFHESARRSRGALRFAPIALAGLLLAGAACHVPAHRPAGEPAAPATAAAPPKEIAVAGAVVSGTVADGGTFEIRILPSGTDPLARAEQAVADDPRSADAYGALGDELAKQGRIAEAIAAYENAARLAPDDPVAHFRLGLTLHVAGDLEGALASYRETARLVPDSAWAHAAISVVHLRLGDRVAALAAYRIVRRLDDQLADGLFEILAEEEDLRRAERPAASHRPG